MPVPSRVTYARSMVRLTAEQQVEAFRHLPFKGAHRLTPPEDSPIETPPDPWDAAAWLPLPALFGKTYPAQLAAIVQLCKAELECYRVRVDSYVQPDKRVRLNRKTAGRYKDIGRSLPVPRLYGWMQLGQRFGGYAPAEVIRLLPQNEIALDPATVLLYLTLTVVHAGTARVLQPMWIDCPGAEYDPEGKGKFSDCPRWNVSTEPSDKDVAFLSLDWNWSADLRARANHGSATVLLEP